MTELLRLPPWGDREIARFQFRVALFKRRGVNERYAEELADRLFERDYERDDRHYCIECDRFQRGDTCFAAQQGWMPNADRRMTVLRYVLQRCPHFKFVTPA